MASCNDVNESTMFIYSKRLETFDGWPFTAETGCKCTAEKLAQAGFFRPHPEQEPELARCFMCHKDLEGWDENDDPEVEHKSHSSKCPFLSIKNRNILTMKFRDFVKFKYIQESQLIGRKTTVAKKRLDEEIQKHLQNFEEHKTDK